LLRKGLGLMLPGNGFFRAFASLLKKMCRGHSREGGTGLPLVLGLRLVPLQTSVFLGNPNYTLVLEEVILWGGRKKKQKLKAMGRPASVRTKTH